MRVKSIHNYSYKPRHRKPAGPDLSLPGPQGSHDCWCGQPYGHDWAGKDKKEPHPR